MLSKGEILTVLTTATEQPEETGRIYHGVFTRLGMDKVQILNINTRKDANQPDNCRLIESSRCLFMTGGDQLRITSILGGTRAYEAIKELYRAGGIIMGTSAGAAVMSSTMIVEGNDNSRQENVPLKWRRGWGFLMG